MRTLVALVVLLAASVTLAKQPARPTITLAAAQETALARVPSGTVQSSELEKEKGRLIYTFDIATPDKQIIEVNVDAHTGDVVAVEHEGSAAKKQPRR
jgi:uncharacterized membrane protein YkoI